MCVTYVRAGLPVWLSPACVYICAGEFYHTWMNGWMDGVLWESVDICTVYRITCDVVFVPDFSGFS